MRNILLFTTFFQRKDWPWWMWDRMGEDIFRSCPVSNCRITNNHTGTKFNGNFFGLRKAKNYIIRFIDGMIPES